MITLYTFGPAFGLPDPSPFVIKAHLLLKMAGLAYVEDTNGFNKAPKGKVPYMSDDGVLIADSTFIHFHIEKKYGFHFDAGLSAEQKAASWAIEKMCEDHLYWATMSHRWMNDENFAKGPAIFFQKAPPLIRPLIVAMVRKKVRRNLQGHGFGRHSDAEINQLAIRDIDALAALIGDKPYLMGDKPCAADAMVFASVAGSLSKVFTSAIRDAAEKHGNLVVYRDRLMAQYFPDMAKAA